MAFASHADADHIAGLIEILDLYEIEEFYWNGQPHTTQTFQNLQEVTQAEGSVIRIVSRGDSISLVS